MSKLAIVFHPSGSWSAVRLAAYMGAAAIPVADADKQKSRPDWLIRWGTPVGMTYKPALGVLNSGDALIANKNRIVQLKALGDAGVRIPLWWDSYMPNISVANPILGRSMFIGGHRTKKGEGITFYPEGSTPAQHDYYVSFIDKARQFRVNVVGLATRTREVIPTTLEAKASPIWNNTDEDFDYKIAEDTPKAVEVAAVAAVKSLNFDFGAVDIITGKDGRVYVLEVNTAPALHVKSVLPWFAGQFARLTGILVSEMPGAKALAQFEEGDPSPTAPAGSGL